LSENSNVISVPTGHTLNVADAGSLQIGGNSLPRGIIGYSSSTATVGVTAATPLSVLTVDATIVPGRRYRIAGKLCYQPSSGNLANKTIYVTASGMTTTQLDQSTNTQGTNLPFTMGGEFIKTATEMGVTTGTGTSLTFTMYFRDSANNGGLNTNPDGIVGANSVPQELYVEDIGAS
jgi:hypothetical protein